MQRKALQVQVELDIQAVTCPGVYLCPNGKISLQLYMLDSSIQTASYEPVFPILCHEKFIFYKTFYEAQRLYDLQRLLNKECLYVELIQWQNSELGNVLASFQTSLNELLYPSTREGSVPGVDIDLLMDPARNFPGLIAPKIEVSTKTIIEDTLCDSTKCNSFVVNPKVIPSRREQIRRNPVHQRKVCHSTGYHRSRKCFPKIRKIGKPPFSYRKVDETLLGRKPQGLGPEMKGKCRCRLVNAPSNIARSSFDSEYDGRKDSEFTTKTPAVKVDCWSKAKSLSQAARNCFCTSSHEYEKCPVCSKYKYYFETTSYSNSPKGEENLTLHPTRKPCLLQKPGKHKNCTCQEMTNTGDARVIRCTSPNQDIEEEATDKICFCKSQFKPSLAERLHRRLNQTLDSFVDCACDVYEIDDNVSQSPNYSPNETMMECECPDMNVGDVYRNLYRHAKSKMGRCDKYVTPCCT